MSMKSEFIEYVEKCMNYYPEMMTNEMRSYWEAFKGQEEVEKPPFTDNGKLILKFMQEHVNDMPAGKSRDIAEQLGMSSRTVSGSIRKLVTDGYVDKLGKDPVIYALTDKGKSVEII